MHKLHYVKIIYNFVAYSLLKTKPTMKFLHSTILSVFLLCMMFSQVSHAQLQLDTIAFQNFETVPTAPVWGYSGTLADVQSGYSTMGSSIPNSPLGINGSQAWHVVSVSGGNAITFDNMTIPAGYDSIRVNFRLAAMNLNGATGGPDNLDYVQVEYSLDNGATFISRLRIRGSVMDNSFWAYDATGVAAVPYLPASETLFQPMNTVGLQTTEGYSFCEISFPGNISQLAIRITPRSSSSTDSWLVDNLVLTAEKNCIPISSSITQSACGSYTSPSGNVYFNSSVFNDTIPSVSGCDSVITINLTVNPITSTSITEIVCNSYTAPSGAVYTSSGVYDDYLISTTGCDSTITINLTVNSNSSSSITATGLDIYTAPSGATYTSSGVYTDVIPNVAGCDSLITIDLTMSYTGLEEVTVEQLRISPNPVKNFITLEGAINVEQLEWVSIIDLTGSNCFLWNSSKLIDVTDIAPGVYFLRVKQNDVIQQVRFMKE